MNEDQVRKLLAGAAQPGWDDDVRASAALYAGQTLVRNRHRRVVGSVITTVLGAAGLVIILPHTAAPTTDVVLGCAAGVGTTGAGLVTGSLDGVTLPVTNPTRDVQTVTAGGSSALALPGTTQVTLPVSSGTTVRCGGGAPVRLTVQHVAHPSSCDSLGTAQAATVQNGEVSDLTREQLGVLPQGAVVDASLSSSQLRRVQVRSAGKVVAEALWHELPGGGDWQLESLSRCR